MVVFILLTPALSNKRGILVLLQLIVFMRKSCVDTYAYIVKAENILLSIVILINP